MKQYLIFIFLLAFNSIDCEIYKCAKNLKKDVCMLNTVEYLGETKQSISYVKACSSGKECKVTNEVGYCLPKQTLQKEGESCVYNFECEIGVCKDNKCKGGEENSACTSNSDCNYETFCSGDHVCKKMFKKGEACVVHRDDRDFDSVTSYCELGLLCGTVGDDTEPKCHDAFSLPIGTKSNNRYLCQSGIEINKVCATAEVTGNRCEIDKKCEVTFITKGENVTENVACNEYMDYTTECPQFDNSSLWMDYIEKYKSTLKKVDTKKTNMKQLNRLLLNNDDLVELGLNYYLQEKIRKEPKSDNEKCYKEFYYSFFKQ